MIELYHAGLSPCAQKVRLALAEKRIEWTSREVDLPAKENLSPEYLKLNPKGVVPTLVDDGRPITESSVICEYLDDAYPETSLRPADLAARAQMRLWTKYVDEVLHPANGGFAWPLLVRPIWLGKDREEVEALIAKVPDPARRDRQKRLFEQGTEAPEFSAGVRAFDLTLSRLEDALADSPYLAGSEISLADQAILPYMSLAERFGFQSLYEANRPAVTDWFARCRAREAYEEAIVRWVPEALLGHLKKQGELAWPKVQEILAAA